MDIPTSIVQRRTKNNIKRKRKRKDSNKLRQERIHNFKLKRHELVNQYGYDTDLNKLINLIDDFSDLPIRYRRVFGVITFKYLWDYINSDDEFISNKMNREEELDETKNYKNKLHHLIRFINGISRKSHLQLSYIKSKANRLYISDDGTMASLAFGQYFDDARLKATQISEIVEDIKENYTDGVSDEFMQSIEEWYEVLNEQQRQQEYSLKELLKNTKWSDEYENTLINFEINPFTINLHTKDQQNANLQPNPWATHNFYKAPMKSDDLYESTLIGDTLLNDEFSNVIGIGKNPSTQGNIIFRNFAANKKKAERDLPFYISKSLCLSLEGRDNDSDLQSILGWNKYISKFNSHEDKKYGKYWYKKYDELVKNCTFSDMKEWVEYVDIVQQDWSSYHTELKKILEAYVHKSSLKPWEELRPFKDDFALYIISVILGFNQMFPQAFGRNIKKNIEEIRKLLIENLIITINGKVKNDNNEEVSLIELFDNGSNVTNWNFRFENVWKYAIKETFNTLTKRKKGEDVFDKEVKHQKNLILETVSQNFNTKSFKGYTFSSKEIESIDFSNTSKYFAGLHCVPRDDKGIAEDGVIWGLVTDNEGVMKYQNLNKLFDSPADYWEKIAQRNQRELKNGNVSERDEIFVKDFIQLCYRIADTKLNYKYKK